MNFSVLIVDDEPDLRDELADGLVEAGLAVQVASSTEAALARLGADPQIAALVTDIRMPGADGISLAERALSLRAPERALRVIVMTGHGSLETATAAMRAGVFDFFQKPFALDDMIRVVESALAEAAEERAQALRLAAAQLRLARAKAEADAARRADALTGLPNRSAFEAAVAAIQDSAAGVAFIGFDGFGVIEAGAGHVIAEAALREAATRLAHVLPEGWLLARIGDAEFAALGAASEADLRRFAEAASTALTPALRIEGRTLALSACFGLACTPGLGATALDDAGRVALAAARRQGGGIMAFTALLQAEAARRLRIAQGLGEAIAQNELRLFYQPLFHPTRRRILGFEALLRWTHPEMGEIGPQEFIPIAEESGQIVPLGHWALSAAAAQAAAWPRWVAQGGSISVNVSPRQLAADDMAARFAAALEANRLAPHALLAEVTESSAVARDAHRQLRTLRALGVKVALDDFGAGYSSLGALRALPLDRVKLDRALIADADSNARARQFFDGLAACIGALGLEVVAEGIETEAQLAIAEAAGCGAVQGFLLGRPMPPVQVEPD